MVADQWKKRPRAASTVDYFHEPDGLKKKKKQGLTRNGLKLRSNISLVWDEKKRCVLAKKEQVGISRRELAPFPDSLPHHHGVMADVFTVPQETFEFENLSEVLSPKVWQANLSEDERAFLMQLLPEGSEPDETVCRLLGEENFHFGNPFLKWGRMICSGGFHPDGVMHREQLFKANKKAYYRELQNYHENMIGNLQLWKEHLESCKDSEEDMVERILRKGFVEGTYGSSPDGAKVFARPRKGEKLSKRNIQHSDGAKYMSYVKVSREHYQRVKNSMKQNSVSIQPRYLSSVLGDVENLHVQPFEFYEEEQRQKLHDHWLHLANRDVPAGFANWTKKRSQLLQVRRSLGQEMEQKVKIQITGNEKECSDGTFAEGTDNKEAEDRKSSYGFSAELTDIKEVDGVFSVNEEVDQQEGEEKSDGLIDEQMETEIVNNGLPLQAELFKVDQHEGEERSDGLVEEQTERETLYDELPLQAEVDQHEGEEKSDGLMDEQMEREIVDSELPLQAEEQEGGDSASLCDKQTPDSTANTGYNDESLPASPHQHLHHVSLDESNQLGHLDESNQLGHLDESNQLGHLDESNQLGHLDESNQLGHLKLDSIENHTIPQADEVSPHVSEYSERLNNVDVPVCQGGPLTSSDGGWPAVSMTASYGCAAPLSHGYSSAEVLSLGHPQATNEAATSLIDLEAAPEVKDVQRDILPRETSEVPLFDSFPPQNRNEIFQQFFKGPGSLSYSHEQKQSPLDFQPSTSLMVDPVQYAGHFREQLHPQLPLEMRQKALNDLIMHQSFQGNLYPDGARYSFPRNDQLNVGMQDWAVNSVHVHAPSQSHLSSGDLLSQNWFSGGNLPRGGWSTLEGVAGPSQSIGSINNSDQSLYSVLSECNQLHQSGSYDLSGSRDRFIAPRTYGVMDVGIPTTSNLLQQQTKPLSYMSSQETPQGLRPNGVGPLGWANMSTQNPGLHDPLGKPYLRSWNP